LLQNRFDKFSSIENFGKLEEELMPKLNNFTDIVYEMEKNHTRMCEIVRKLDEDVSMKANKEYITLLKEELSHKYVHNETQEENEEKFQEIHDMDEAKD